MQKNTNAPNDREPAPNAPKATEPDQQTAAEDDPEELNGKLTLLKEGTSWEQPQPNNPPLKRSIDVVISTVNQSLDKFSSNPFEYESAVQPTEPQSRKPFKPSYKPTYKGTARKLTHQEQKAIEEARRHRKAVARGLEKPKGPAKQEPKPKPRSSSASAYPGYKENGEREWPTSGYLQFDESFDVACQYCINDARNQYVARNNYQERKFANVSALHKHVQQWHIEHPDANMQDVILDPKILSKDGKTTFLPKEDCGPLVPVLQLEAAKKFGMIPAWPHNRPPPEGKGEGKAKKAEKIAGSRRSGRK